MFLVAKWILVVGGLITALEAVAGYDPVDMLGSLAPVFDVVVFGGAALLVGYHLLTMHKK